MKSKFLLALLVPVAAFIIGCGPTDMHDDINTNTNELSSEIVDQNIDGVDGLNLTEDSKSDYWLGLYIPSAFYYYTAPFYWGSYYPHYLGYSSYFYPYYYGWRY